MTTGIGDTLRDEREAQGRTLEDAAHALRLRTEQVRALEEERFDSFGGDVYARGFLRNYAIDLGLDPQPLLDTYRREVSGDDPLASAPLVTPGQGARVRTPRAAPPGWIAWVLVAVIVLAGLAFLGQFVGSGRAPEQASSEPSSPPVAPADDGDEPETETDPPATDADGADGDEVDGEPEEVEEEEPAIDGVELFLALEADSWMRVTVDGTVVFEQVAPQGETLQYEGEDSVTVRFGNAGGVRVELNGEDLGTPGPRGSVVEMEYTPDGESEV